MGKCPICGRPYVEYDPQINKKRCLWNDCGWVENGKSKEKPNKSKFKNKYNINFSEFRDSLERKKAI